MMGMGMGAPPVSRPPSRVDNNARASRIDLSSEHATAVSSNARTLREQEEMNDPDIQRAVAESMRSTLPAQENGVTGAGAHFGPANREFYEPSNWALTTYSTSREIIDHPPPSKRRRIDDEPVFLRGSKETDYLGPLLTIYHSIPLAREALLMPNLKIHSYGHDPSWWSGTTDENTKALSTDSSLQLDRDECNLVTEVQCLMGFLDNTNRAYGSVDALADIQAVRSSKDSGNYIRFLSAWQGSALHQAPNMGLDQIFGSIATRNPGPGEARAERKPLLCVEPFIHPGQGETLVELLDRTVWADDGGSIDDVWIDQVAEIFTIFISDPHDGKNGSLELTLDPVWYPDRYMLEYKDATQEMRRQMLLLHREIAHCTSIQRRCDILKMPDNRTLMIREVLDAAVKASVEVVGKKPAAPSGLTDGGQLSGSQESLDQAQAEAVEADLQALLQRIEQKFRILEQRKAELRTKMRQIALQFTKPTPENPDVPSQRYALQGVSTKPNVTYVRRPNTDLLLLEEDEDSSDSPEWQWWRLAWIQDELQQKEPPPPPALPTMGPVTQAQAEASSKKNLGFTAGLDFDRLSKLDGPELNLPKPYEVRKVTETEVLEAAKKEHSSVLLVYASENALQFQGSELSMALRHFVDRDNQAFAEELQQEEGPIQEIAMERDVEVEFEDVPLIDQNGSSSSVRELTPMSTSSPGRDEEGQASPKRLKGDHALNILSEQPPSYEDSLGRQEMQERKGNKIGFHAEQMLQKYGNDSKDSSEKDDNGSFVHVENGQSS